jgi:precorrin-6B methylase 2
MTAMTSDAILGIGRAFMESRVLLTAVELDVFTPLAGRAMTADDLAAVLGTDRRATTVLLDALAALALLDKHEGAYRCPPEVAALLSEGSERSVAPMLRHSVALWRRWSALTDVVRTGRPADRPEGAQRERDREAFIAAMHAVAAPMAAAVAAAVRPGAATRFLDVGGASGTYTEAFLAACPGLRATLFDLPPVIEIARRRLRSAGVADRVTFVAGDFDRDPLPPGHDLALLSAIIHQNSAEENVELFRKVRQALLPGGRLIVRDHVMSPDHTRPARGALFAVNMLVGTAGGGTYSFAEIGAGLEAAGFTGVRLLQDDDQMNGLVEAFVPPGA